MQPSQQHGLRMPSLSSLMTLLICSCLVSSFLTKVTQHIHSLRASGVRSCHTPRAAISKASAFRKSAGSLCTVPFEIACLLMIFNASQSRIKFYSLQIFIFSKRESYILLQAHLIRTNTCNIRRR